MIYFFVGGKENNKSTKTTKSSVDRQYRKLPIPIKFLGKHSYEFLVSLSFDYS